MDTFELAQKAVESGFESKNGKQYEFAQRLNYLLRRYSPAQEVQPPRPSTYVEPAGKSIDVSKYYNSAPRPKKKDAAPRGTLIMQGREVIEAIYSGEDGTRRLVDRAKSEGHDVNHRMKLETVLDKIFAHAEEE